MNTPRTCTGPDIIDPDQGIIACRNEDEILSRHDNGITTNTSHNADIGMIALN